MIKTLATIALTAVAVLGGSVTAMNRYMDTIPSASQEDRERASYVALRVGLGGVIGASIVLFGTAALQGDNSLSVKRLRKYAQTQAKLGGSSALDWEIVDTHLAEVESNRAPFDG